MRIKYLVVSALALCACAAGQSFAADAPKVSASYSPPAHTSMPPRLMGDCITYILLDNKCTADWYSCSDGDEKGHCAKAWENCCTLPGNPARTTIVKKAQTP